MGESNGSIGVGLELTNDKQFRQALNNIKSDFKVLDSEMKKVSASFGDNADSIEALRAKSDILNRQLTSQTDKVDLLRKALENAQKQYPDNVNKINQWKTSLNNAEAELSILNKKVEENKKAIDNYGEPVDNATNKLDEFGQKVLSTGDIVKANLVSAGVVTGVGLLGSAISNLTDDTIGFAKDSQIAFNNLIATTGATEDEFSSLENIMKSIYAENFGESIDDVSESLAIVKQQTGLANDELKDMTEQALLVRDTFDMDVTESVRATKMMMDQFGISSKEAYNLVVQGVQNGLNKNDDLLDTLNEYSVQFSQIGLSATDMMNMLKNGAESGTFSVDKLGDALKEFGIRVKDGSDSTNGAFKMLGMDANLTANAFAKGGESARKALQEVIKKISDVDDPVKQNSIGVALLGTMWEDLGASAINSLMNVNGSISTTNKALDEINNRKYNDLGSALNAVGREIQVSIAKPLTEELTPSINNLISEIRENAPEIEEDFAKLGTTISNGLGWIIDNSDLIISGLVGMGAAFATKNTIASISAIVKGYKEFKIAIEEATVAETVFNDVTKANPIGLATTAVIGLVTAIALYAKSQRKATDESRAFQKEIKNISNANTKLINDIKDIDKSYQNSVSGIKDNYGAIDILSNKLFDLADKENKSNGEKAQMQSLVNQLNQSIPNLNLVLNAETGHLNKQRSEINGIVVSMREKAIQEANEQQYLEIAKQQVVAQNNLSEAKKVQKEAQDKYNKALKEQYDLENSQPRGTVVNRDDVIKAQESVDKYKKALTNANVEVDRSSKTIEKCNSEFDNLDNQISDTTNTTDKYSKTTNSSTKVVSSALMELQKQYQDAKKTATDSIKSQISLFDKFTESSKVSKKQLLDNLKSQVDGVTNWVNNIQKLSKRGILSSDLLDELKSMGVKASGEIKALTTMSDKELKEYNKAWVKLGKETARGADVVTSDLKKTYDKAYKDEMKSANTNGKATTIEFGKGILSAKGNIDASMLMVVNGSLVYAKNNSDAQSVGSNLIDGIRNGVISKQSALGITMTNIGNQMINDIKASLDIHSPSRRGEKEIGVNFALGVIKGVNGRKGEVKKSAKEIGEDLLTQAKQSLDNYNVYHTMSVAEEVKYWNKIRQSIKKGTQARIDADKEYFDAKKRLQESDNEKSEEILSKAQTRLDNYKVYHNMSIASEIKYWDKIRKELKKGTQARIDADKEYYDAKDRLREANEEKEEQQLTKAKERAEKKAELLEKETEAEKEYKDNVSKINTDLTNNVQSLAKTYNDAIESRTSAIVNSMSLFSELNINKDITGNQLLSNLEGQVSGLQKWKVELGELKDKGVSDGLLKQLQDLGVSSLGEVTALNSLTGEELNKYVTLWEQKSTLAKDEAVKELDGLKTETSVKIQELTAQSNKDLETYYATYKKAMKELGVAIKEPITTVKTTISTDGASIVTNVVNAMYKTINSSSNIAKLSSIKQTLLSSLSIDMDTQDKATNLKNTTTTNRGNTTLSQDLLSEIGKLSSTITTPKLSSITSSTSAVAPQVNEFNYKLMAKTFANTLAGMKVEMDDEPMGKFVLKTVEREVYG